MSHIKKRDGQCTEHQNTPQKGLSVFKWLREIKDRYCSSSIYKTYRIFRNGYKNKKRELLKRRAQKKLIDSVKAPMDGINRSKRERDIVVSLTTYPARADLVCIVLRQLLSQTLKPDRILLHLAEEQFPGRKLPDWAESFREAGIEFVFCRDLKPHKKYYFAMQQFPDAIVITVDDDLHYSNDLVETLYNSYLRFPNAISALRTHEITFDGDGHILPYEQWNVCSSEYISKPMMRLFATSGAGTLFPPHSLHPEVFNEKNLSETCLFADDLWLKVMSVLNGTPVVLVKAQKKIEYIMWTQEEALWYENVGGGKNDTQLQMILERYSDFFGRDNSFEKLIRD